jgi:hypothetical protein
MPGFEHVRDYSYPTGFDSLEKVEGWARDIWKQIGEAEHGFAEDLELALSQKFYFTTITGITNDVVADQQEDTLTLATGNALLSIVGTAATDTITWTWAHLGFESLSDPGADRIPFWDDGETALKWLAPDGTSLEISATTLQVKANGINDLHIDWGTGANQVSAVDVPIADTGSYYTGTEVEAALQEAMVELKVHQLTGFEDASSVALSTDSGNPPTITLTFTGTVYWWSDGVRYSDSGTDALQMADSSGVHWIYYDGATLSAQVNPSDAEFDAILTDKAFVSIIYFNATTNASYVVANELHGAEMSGETHRWLHDSVGSNYHEGLTISGYTPDTATNAALSFEITDGNFFDEDLKISIVDGSAANQYEQQLNGGDASIPVLYRNAAGEWTEQAASTLPYIVSGTTLRYMDADNSYAQTSLGNNQYMNMFLVATNDWQYPIKMIQGTDEYSKQEYSQGAVGDEIVDWGTLPSAEWVLLYQIILKQSSGESVDGKIIDVIDYRFTGITGASATSQDHGSLSGLSDDDHAQYALHSLSTAANDFLVGSGSNTWIKKTLAEAGAILEGDIVHDNLQSIPANDHIDWTNASDNFGTSGTLGAGVGTLTSLTLGTGELTCGSINRASGNLTLEVGGTAAFTIVSSAGANSVVIENNQLGIGVSSPGKTLDMVGGGLRIKGDTANFELWFDATPSFAAIFRTLAASFGIGTFNGSSWTYDQLSVNTSGDMTLLGSIRANGGFNDNGSAGVDGSFTAGSGETVTVSGGIITNIV